MEPASVFDRSMVWVQGYSYRPNRRMDIVRLVSTIRRVIDLYLFEGLTVVVCIPRLLAAVVILEKYSAPPVLFV